MEQKVFGFKIRLTGAEGSPCIEKAPASDKDVLAALNFLTETSEMVVSCGYFEKDESGNWIECSL